MKINIKNLPLPYEIAEIRPEIFSLTDGIEVTVRKSDHPGYILNKQNSALEIQYNDISALMTAFGDIISGLEQESFTHPLEFRGVMLDASRNAVPNGRYLREILVNLALLGCNRFCLYTEDTFEVDGEPLFGYGRGYCSKTEITEAAKFADSLGILMFPCIQTLGHFEQVLKYHEYAFLRDTERVLHAGKKETYVFLEKIIRNAMAPYREALGERAGLIHIGMDEPWGIGRGAYFKANTPISPLKIYAEHVAKVAEICRSLKLAPVMWGDFVTGDSGEKAMGDTEKSILPDDMTMDYWQYDCTDTAEYEKKIKIFLNMGCEPIFSPGVHSWGRFFSNLNLAGKTIPAGMKAVHNSGVKKVLITMWGDDGHESLFPFSFPALALFAEAMRIPDPDPLNWKKRAELLFGIDMGKFANIAEIEDIEKIYLRASGGVGTEPGVFFSSKTLFYDDPLCGCASRLLKNPANFADELKKLIIKLDFRADADSGKSPFDDYFRLASLFLSVTAGKVSMTTFSASAYAAGNKEALAQLAEIIPVLLELCSEFRRLYKVLWMRERKPFGLEVIDIRLAGVHARIETFAETLEAYLNGEIDSIPEFEMELSDKITGYDMRSWSKASTRCYSIF